ncbi:TRAP transporter small permease subunit [Tropicimonas sp. S265A]|uniref:TRAP transporter small permease subunit n=1 Tax=Tropicimonas sp. S265A TaxID=3415134 RepID=UPI003C7BB68E
MADTILRWMRAVNRIVALGVGLMLLICAAFVLADIVLRQLGSSFGGTDEVSGYAMAIATSWGMAYTLLELGHVRIDLVRSRLPDWPRALLDLFAMLVMTLVISLIAYKCWPVVGNSLANNSTANTPLETPLALVQIPWFAGWLWFALSAWITLLAAALLVVKGRLKDSENAIGAFAEAETLQ